MEKICRFCVKGFVTNKSKQSYCSIACGLKSRRKADNNIFEELDSFSAYVLGWIWSDGNLSSYLDKNQKLREYLTLSSVDEEELNKVRGRLTPTKKLYSQVGRGEGVVKKGEYKRLYSVKTSDPEIIKSLKVIGLRAAKSLTLEWPSNLPNDLFWPFIRGYFDGDGCAYLSTPNKGKHTYLNIKFTCGSAQFVTQLRDLFLVKGIDSRVVIDERSNTPGLLITKKDSVRKFYDHLYLDGELFLKRKKLIFDSFYAAIPVIF